MIIAHSDKKVKESLVKIFSSLRKPGYSSTEPISLILDLNTKIWYTFFDSRRWKNQADDL